MTPIWLLSIVAAPVLVLTRWLYIKVQRRRFMVKHGCTSAPRIPQKPFAFGSDSMKTWEEKQATGGSVAYIADLLMSTPGRTAVVDVALKPWLRTCDPDNIKTICSLEDAFVVEEVRKPMAKGWLGDGMFISDGQFWKHSRNVFKAIFARVPILNLQRHDVHYARFFDSLPSDGSTVDLQPRFKRLYFLDTSSDLILGVSANSQFPGQETFDIDEFENSFEKAMLGSFKRAFGGIHVLPYDDEAQWKQSCANVHRVFNTQIQSVLDRHRKAGRPLTSSDYVTMLENLMEFSQDKVFLRDQLLNVYIGAKHGVAVGIENMIFQLARHPNVYAKLRTEVLTKKPFA